MSFHIGNFNKCWQVYSLGMLPTKQSFEKNDINCVVINEILQHTAQKFE